jgi:hypothetical protein
MIRKYITYVEFTFLAGYHLLFLAVALSALWAAAAQTTTPPMTSNSFAITDFLSSLESNAEVKALGAPSSLQRRYLEENDTKLGYRIVKDKNKDAFQTANQFADAFARECVAKGGKVDEDDAPHVRHLLARQNTITSGTGITGVWAYQHRVAVCSKDDTIVLGHMAAFIHDNTPYGRTYKSQLISSLLAKTLSNTTLVMAFPGNSTASRRDIAKLDAERLAAAKAREAQLAQWQNALAIGDATNCGTVIEVRGPMVEIASGSQTLWSRRDVLYPAGYRLDPSGLVMGCAAK